VPRADTAEEEPIDAALLTLDKGNEDVGEEKAYEDVATVEE
jgi:hypothetical protein